MNQWAREKITKKGNIQTEFAWISQGGLWSMQSNLFFEKASNFPDMSICSSAAGHFFHLRKKNHKLSSIVIQWLISLRYIPNKFL